MKKYLLLNLIVLLSMPLSSQTRYTVASNSEFSTAQQAAETGDTIVWMSGVYTNIRMDIEKDGLIVRAEKEGTVLFKGASRANIFANDITFAGFQYVGGNIANLDVIRVYGRDILITQINIQNYISYKYLVVDEESRRTTISYCNFENRLNLDDKNILSILVDDEPGFHKIQHCSFKNFEGIGLDEGIEPIRIGVSTQGELDSRTLVEYCYFTRCDGDGEIISHKSRQNVYRYNTFENNPVAELVLRHGDEGIVYGNFFLNNMGGVRIREGSHHYIFNNYFENQTKRPIYLMNDPADPLSYIHIYHNTFVNTERLRLGGTGSSPPSNVTLANNVLVGDIDRLFQEDTGDEIWIENFAFGDIGISPPTEGLLEIDPQLYENELGYTQPSESSPLISASGGGYPAIPLYEGMDYDHEMKLDIMMAERPSSVANRTIGASEYSSSIIVQPHATELNTGPTYLFDNLVDYIAASSTNLYLGEEGESRTIHVSSNIEWTVSSSANWISTDLSSGSKDSELKISVDANDITSIRSGTVTLAGGTELVTINIYQDAGQVVSVLNQIEKRAVLYPNPTSGQTSLMNLPSGHYEVMVNIMDYDGKVVSTKDYQVLNKELLLNLEDLKSGIYLVQFKINELNTSNYTEITRKLIKN